jgi:hypothetical protein
LEVQLNDRQPGITDSHILTLEECNKNTNARVTDAAGTRVADLRATRDVINTAVLLRNR